MKNDRALAYGAFAIVCIVWGTTYLGIRIAVETMTPLLLTGFRFTVAGAVLLTVSRLRGDVFPTDRRTLANLALIGFLMVGVGNLAVVWAEQWVPSGMAALLVASSPFWNAILELIRKQGERLDLRRGIGMLIGFIGVALLVTPRGAAGSFDVHFILGALAIQLGAICWQAGTMRAKYTVAGVPPLMSAGVQMLFGGIIVTTIGFAIGEAPHFHVTPRTFAALAYLTLFGSVIAYTAYVFALAKIRTTNMSLYAYINPVVAVLLGWLILDERLTWVSITAMVVILGGVALVQTAGARRKPLALPDERAAERNAA